MRTQDRPELTAEALTPVGDVLDRTLTGSLYARRRQPYKLQADRRLVGLLSREGFFRPRAVATAAGEAWTFRHVRRRSFTFGREQWIIESLDGKEVARFGRDGPLRGLRLRFADGTTLPWRGGLSSFGFAQAYRFEWPSGERVATFTLDGPSVQIDLYRGAPGLSPLPLVVLFGWFLAVLAHEAD